MRLPFSRLYRALAACLATAMVAGSLAPAALHADDAFSFPNRFAPRDGETLYKRSCQACHMASAEGAVGSAAYPPLAKNQKLRTGRYITAVVTNGQKGMPPFGPMMDDEQIAAVVNYVRTHFGNDFKDAITAADVKTIRR